MIYTVTLNPALDYVCKTDDFEVGRLNRTSDYNLFVGGKGINVSRVLKNLEVSNVALGFIAGFTGDVLKLNLDKLGVRSDFIKVKEGLTRINVKINSNVETELNAAGPIIKEEDLKLLLDKLDSVLTNGDYLVLAGSVARGLKLDVYKKIMEHLKDKKIKIIVDTEKEALLDSLCYHPFLVKPNKYELEEIFDVKLNSLDEVKEYAYKLQEKGAQNVLVSLGAKGAILVDMTGAYYYLDAKHSGTLSNSVGSGDSMIAGFLYGLINTENFKEALNYGISAGSATAFGKDLASKEEILRLLSEE